MSIAKRTEENSNKRSKKKLGVAILGFGKYAEERLAPALQKTRHCYLAGIISDSENKMNELKKKFNVSHKNVYSYHTFNSIKSNKEIDIVYVVLPNAMHREYVIRAAKAGKHVICEKPMAITVEDCDKMIDACKEADVMLSIGYRLHFEPHNIKAMELGTKQVFGAIKSIRAENGISDIDGWRLNKKLSGGGALMDVGVYCIQGIRYTTGMEPVAVTACEGAKTDKDKFKDVEESLTWQMEMPDGVIAECKCSYSEDIDFLRADAENGWFELSPAFAYEKIKGKTSSGEMHIKNVNQQARQMDDFAIAIKNNRPTVVPGEMGRQDVKILQSIYAAMKSGKRIKIE